MNLDTLSYITDIKGAISRVQSSAVGGCWVLLGYTEGDEGAKRLNLMTVNVIKEGSIWRNLLTSLEDDKIQYGFAKLDLEAEGNAKSFLIHWVGKDVGENEKISCMPHLNEIRNLIPSYDLLVNSMEPLDVQSKVHSYLSRSQSINVESRPSRSCSSSLMPQIKNISGRDRASSNAADEKDRNTLMRTYTHSDDIGSLDENAGSLFQDSEQNETQLKKSMSYRTLKRVKFKVAIIGSVGVGKTFIYLSYNEGGSALSNPQSVAATTFADCMTKEVSLEEHRFTLEIWDTAGQERYIAFAPVWTRNAKVVICVYDLTDEQSYVEMPKLIQTAKEYADPKAVFFLVGNKADLVHRREVQEAEAERFAIQHDMMFIECSGLTGLNVLNLFESVTRRVVFIYPGIFNLPSTDTSTTADQVIRLEADRNLKAKEGCKC
eukprot:TRINITY_DN787_c0_g3_i4.p1 TRINITY_DN787_c0_g3~~TRINITY_DN787_c0_g3_i4.p1  ORF type:complete len:433 (-),score=74.78 TRINITY_DN787_c0_g3_i4:14-1312(-)